MEMFNVGGLKDEGGTKDPVSGNDVPSGSLKEEVRDDIDAKLSPGEFVFPADVTRFLGLRFLMELRDKAKAGLQRMEDMGQMGNSEEAVLDNDVPFEPTDLIIMAGPPEGEMNKMNTGGMPVKLQTGGDMSDFANVPGTFGPVPGQGRFDQIIGQPQFEYEIKKFRNDAGAELFIPFVRGNPVYQPPLGYEEVTETQQQEELADPTGTSARVETARLQKARSSMDPDVSGIGVNEMTMTERAAVDIPESVRGIVSGAVSLGVAGLGGFLGNVGQEAAKKTGMIDETVRDLMSKKMANDFSLIDEARAKLAAMTPAQREAQRARDQAQIEARAARDAEDQYGAPLGHFGTTVTIGNNVYGVDRFGTVTDLTDPNKDIIGGKLGKKARDLADKKNKEADDRSREAVSTYGSGAGPMSPGAMGGRAGLGGEPIGMGGGMEGSTSGPSGGPGSGPDPSGMGGGPQTAGDAVGGDDQSEGMDGNKGGFVPKKKKPKKMKRGGLASR